MTAAELKVTVSSARTYSRLRRSALFEVDKKLAGTLLFRRPHNLGRSADWEQTHSAQSTRPPPWRAMAGSICSSLLLFFPGCSEESFAPRRAERCRPSAAALFISLLCAVCPRCWDDTDMAFIWWIIKAPITVSLLVSGQQSELEFFFSFLHSTSQTSVSHRTPAAFLSGKPLVCYDMQ